MPGGVAPRPDAAQGGRDDEAERANDDTGGASVLASGVSLSGVFGDVVFLAITVAFFGLAWLLVRACERIGGEDEPLVEHDRGSSTGRLDEVDGVEAAPALVGGRR
jgi:hypothetical protein